MRGSAIFDHKILALVVGTDSLNLNLEDWLAPAIAACVLVCVVACLLALSAPSLSLSLALPVCHPLVLLTRAFKVAGSTIPSGCHCCCMRGFRYLLHEMHDAFRVASPPDSR